MNSVPPDRDPGDFARSLAICSFRLLQIRLRECVRPAVWPGCPDHAAGARAVVTSPAEASVAWFGSLTGE